MDPGLSTEEEKGTKRVEVAVVGAGQAGLSLSYFLQRLGVEHVVLERDRPLAAWNSRWEGFVANTPNWMNTLPMLPTNATWSSGSNGFAAKDELLEYLNQCLELIDPPIKAPCEVTEIIYRGPRHWEVITPEVVYTASAVAVCSGAMSKPHLPDEAKDVPDSVPQLHSIDYRNPDQIETKNVLIVGSASSGVQICRLLADSKRFHQVSMSVGRVTTLPRNIFGIQIHRFLNAFGLFKVKNSSILGRLMYSNLENKGDPVLRPNAKDLAKMFGVRLFGRVTEADNRHIHFADGKSLPYEDLTIVWCTGLRGEYSIIDVGQQVDAFNQAGAPRHERGVVQATPGLFFVGLRYQHTVASHDIYGVGADAEYVAKRIASDVKGRTHDSPHGPNGHEIGL